MEVDPTVRKDDMIVSAVTVACELAVTTLVSILIFVDVVVAVAAARTEVQCAAALVLEERHANPLNLG